NMRSSVNNNGRWGRRTGKKWYDGMAKHVDAIMKRAKERRTNLINTSRRVPQRLTQPISPHKRLKERAGLWMFAKQSEIITEPNMITSSIRRKVQEDVRAIMAEDSHDRRQMWNRARQGIADRINSNAGFRVPSSSDVFDIPSCSRFEKETNLESPVNETTVFSTKEDSTLDDKDLCLFPADPLLLDYAERILSALPQLFLQNDDRTSYSIAATGIIACSLRRHGKLWRSFFENLSPLNSFSVDSALLTGSSSSSVKLFEFEDIPASSEHILSNSDDANTISNICRSPKNPLCNNISDPNFSAFFPKIGRNVESSANLSINSNDLMELATDGDFSTNISYNLPLRQSEFDLGKYHPITASSWLEGNSANMSNASKTIYRNAKSNKTQQSCQPMEFSFIEPAISEATNNNQWMINSSVRKKICPEMPNFHLKSNNGAAYDVFNSSYNSQTSHFSFDF
ncbi:unnamed protein product, partial [Onchocerca ochengi]|uniref:Protein kinase domain-containing protein n=1 Tax=Onchocerca ochengi TaxID=42157 RepID=A0A182EEA1_ONCOC